MSNFGSFSYFQTSLSLGVEQGLQKLPKFDINDLKFLFHCCILIPRKCPHKIPFNSQCLPPPSNFQTFLRPCGKSEGLEFYLLCARVRCPLYTGHSENYCFPFLEKVFTEVGPFVVLVLFVGKGCPKLYIPSILNKELIFWQLQ